MTTETKCGRCGEAMTWSETGRGYVHADPSKADHMATVAAKPKRKRKAKA